jgi:hypothetical protein
MGNEGAKALFRSCHGGQPNRRLSARDDMLLGGYCAGCARAVAVAFAVHGAASAAMPAAALIRNASSSVLARSAWRC